MNIKRVSATDLFSYANLSLELDALGLVSVEGINHDDGGSNGAGKTSIYKILCWTLYGDPLSKVRVEEVIRLDTETREPVVGMTCGRVELEVDGKNVEVARYQKHEQYGNKILLFINGNNCTKSTNRETQKDIDQILQLDNTAFTSVVLFQQNAKGFASATDSEQKAVFEKVLCLERFSEAHERKKSAVKDIIEERDAVDARMQDTLRRIEESKSVIDDLNDRNTEFQSNRLIGIQDKQTKLSNLSCNKPEVSQELLESKANLEATVADRTRVETVILKANQLVSASQAKYSSTVGSIAALKSQVKDQPAEPVKPEFDLPYYQDMLAQANRTLGTCIAQKAVSEQKIKQILADSKRRESTKTCELCGQDLSENAKIRLFGKLQDDVVIHEEAVASYIKQIEANKGIIESNQRMLSQAQDHDAWNKTNYKAAQTRISIANFERSLHFLESETTRLEGVRDKAHRVLSNIADVKDELGAINVKISQQTLNLGLWQKDMQTLRDEIAKLEVETSPFTPLVGKEESRLTTLVEKYKVFQEQYATLEEKVRYEEFWIRGFSRSGVVSMLLDEVVPELNHRANEYLDVLTDGKAWVEFSTKTTLATGEQREKFSITVNYDNGASVYGAVSGGEMRRVDIAILLALGDVAASRAHAPVRLRLLDEPFDNLDAVGKERVVKLLQEKIVPHVGTLLVMSHDEDLKSMFDKRIVVEKKNGISTIQSA